MRNGDFSPANAMPMQSVYPPLTVSSKSFPTPAQTPPPAPRHTPPSAPPVPPLPRALRGKFPRSSCCGSISHRKLQRRSSSTALHLLLQWRQAVRVLDRTSMTNSGHGAGPNRFCSARARACHFDPRSPMPRPANNTEPSGNSVQVAFAVEHVATARRLRAQFPRYPIDRCPRSGSWLYLKL